MVYPIWYLVALVAFWALVPAAGWLGYDLWRTGRRAFSIRHRQWFWAYAFLSVALAWSTLFLFWPLVLALRQSMTDFSLASATATRWVGLDNYRTTLADPFWWHTLWVTLLFVAFTLPINIVVSMFLAMQILRQPPRVQTFFKAALYVPGVVSPVVGAAVLKWIFHSGDGFANMVLERAGLPPQNWLGDPTLAMPVLIVMTCLSANGVGVIVYSAALGNIPRTFYEVALLDGASPWNTFRMVTWPLVKPTTIFIAVTGLIGGFQVFAPALLITGGGPLKSTYFLNYHIYHSFYYQSEFGAASAMAVMLMVVIVGLSVATYRWLATDVEY